MAPAGLDHLQADKATIMNRHPLDTVSLVAGVLFLLGGLRLLAGPVWLRDLSLDWVGPLALVVIGIAVLASLRTRSQ